VVLQTGDPFLPRRGRPTAAIGLFYGCTGWPACKGAHGAHPDGRPLGTPADKATKQARIEAHAAFDRLWQGEGKRMSRGEAYRWMRKALDLPPAEVHIGRFSKERCVALVKAVNDLLGMT
jgi:zinc-finger-containing domain